MHHFRLSRDEIYRWEFQERQAVVVSALIDRYDWREIAVSDRPRLGHLSQSRFATPLRCVPGISIRWKRTPPPAGTIHQSGSAVGTDGA
jgi:hypothetical protein